MACVTISSPNLGLTLLKLMLIKTFETRLHSFQHFLRVCWHRNYNFVLGIPIVISVNEPFHSIVYATRYREVKRGYCRRSERTGERKLKWQAFTRWKVEKRGWRATTQTSKNCEYVLFTIFFSFDFFFYSFLPLLGIK